MTHPRFTLLIVGALLAGCTGHDSTAPSILQAPSTVAPSTAAPSTVTPPTVTPQPTDSLPPEAVAVEPVDIGGWLSEQAAAGRPYAYVGKPDGPRLMVAYSEGGATVATLLVLGGVGFPVAAPRTARGMLDAQVVQFGEVVALLQLGNAGVRLDLFDPATHQWSEGPDLGIDGPFGNTWLYTGEVAGHLLVSAVTWSREGGMRPSQQAGAIVARDLTTRPMSAPSNPDIPMAWNVSGVRVAALLGLETQADTEHNLLRPWVFDPVSNAWTELQNPPGVECTRDNGCGWFAMHEGVDFVVWEALPAGVVTTGPGGVWLLDEATLGWSALPGPPLDPSGASSWSLADGRLLMVPQSRWSSPAEFGTIAYLDPVAGTWITATLPVTTATGSGAAPPTWVVRVSSDAVLLGVTVTGEDAAVQFAIDRRTGEWRAASAADTVEWPRLASGDAMVSALVLAWSA
ncbi:MAG: hypothetical protein WCC60_08340 [Ilumatobacteraceae bacterium]